MSIQLNMILLMTRLINVKKVFTLQGDSLKKELKKKQQNVDIPKDSHFPSYQKEELIINEHTLYKFSKKGHKKAVLYLPGGGFVLPISGLHWDYLSELSATIEADIFVGLYPLAPAFNVDDVLAYITSAVSTIKEMGYEELTLMGDSSGGNISLAAVQLAEVKHQIDKVIAICPLVDFSLTNPKIAEVAKKDTIVATPALGDIRLWYANGRPVTSPLISPIFGQFDELNVFILSGTRDITNPDSNRMAQRHPDINYLELADLPHVFALYPIPEAELPNKKIQEFINS